MGKNECLLTNILVARQSANIREAGCHASLGHLLQRASRKEEVDPGGYLDNVLLVSNIAEQRKEVANHGFNPAPTVAPAFTPSPTPAHNSPISPISSTRSSVSTHFPSYLVRSTCEFSDTSTRSRSDEQPKFRKAGKPWRTTICSGGECADSISIGNARNVVGDYRY